MPHTYPRAAFASGAASANSLLSLYCSLVTAELAFKDRSPTWLNGHKIGQWLTDEGDGPLTSLTQQLVNAFDDLRCTDRQGNSTRLQVDSYPDLRYLRHEIDFPGETSTEQLDRCLDLCREITVLLKSKGML